MKRPTWLLTALLASLLLAPAVSRAAEEGAGAPEAEPAPEATAQEPAPDTGPKHIDGMSILGNQEAPKSLVIVPWKSSRIGEGLGISTLLDDSRQPIDRDVFLRELSYHEIRSGDTP